MKIVIMVHNLTGGGAERVAVSWANGMVKLGHDVIMMVAERTEKEYPLDERVRVLNISEDLHKANFMPGPLQRRYNVYLAIKKMLRQEHPDAIVSVLHWWNYETLLAMKATHIRPKYIMTDHNPFEWPDGYIMSQKRKFDKFRFSKYYDVMTVLTYPDKKVLSDHGVNNVEVLHNPLAFDSYYGKSEREKVILAVGRTYEMEYKGFDNLLRAWNRLAPEYPDWKLRIIGARTPQSKKTMEDITTCPDRVDFMDFTDNIIEEYRKAEIYCLSSRYEGWGLVLVEAMSQGCACVSTDFRGRQQEIITDGVDGVICGESTPDNIYAGLKKMLDDEDLRDRCRKAARESVKQFSEENTALNLLQIINNVPSKKK